MSLPDAFHASRAEHTNIPASAAAGKYNLAMQCNAVEFNSSRSAPRILIQVSQRLLVLFCTELAIKLFWPTIGNPQS